MGVFYKTYALLFARKSLAKFNKAIVEIGLRGLGVNNHHNYTVTGEKFFLHKELKKYTINTIFDVGANEGNYAKFFLGDKTKTIYCFEPSEVTFNLLKKNISSSNVKLIHTGLSNEIGTATFYDYQEKESSSHATLYKEVIAELREKEVQKIEITLTTLDKYVTENNISHINLLKIDTEGNEYKILEGAKNTLLENKIDIIQMEFNEMNIYSRVFLKDFVTLLPQYNLYRLLPYSLLPITYKRPLEYELFAFQNIIAIRKEIDKS